MLATVLVVAGCDRTAFEASSFQQFAQCMEKNSVPGVDAVRTMCAAKHSVVLQDEYVSDIVGEGGFKYKEAFLADYGHPTLDTAMVAHAFSGQLTNENVQVIITSCELEVVHEFGPEPDDERTVERLVVEDLWLEPHRLGYFSTDHIGAFEGRADLDNPLLGEWTYRVVSAKGLIL
jgi:hypothetical protein